MKNREKMLGMKNHFDISGSIEIREVDIAGVACIYSPGAGADNPLGPNFDVNRNILSLQSFVASLKKKSL